MIVAATGVEGVAAFDPFEQVVHQMRVQQILASLQGLVMRKQEGHRRF
jgi:hypothetical protein